MCDEFFVTDVWLKKVGHANLGGLVFTGLSPSMHILYYYLLVLEQKAHHYHVITK